MAMIDAYRIGVELVLGGDLAAGVAGRRLGRLRLPETVRRLRCVETHLTLRGLMGKVTGRGGAVVSSCLMILVTCRCS